MDLFPFLYTGIDTMNTKRTDSFPSKIQLIFSVVATFGTDSGAAIGISTGPVLEDCGTWRHTLWVQEKIRTGAIVVRKVRGCEPRRLVHKTHPVP